MTGKARINVNGKEVQLWFNRFAQFEMFNEFGIDLTKADDMNYTIGMIQEKISGNFMSLISDLIWFGIVGQREATMEKTPIERKTIRLAVAKDNIPFEDLTKVSEVFFKAMGSDIEVDDNEKKDDKRAKKK